MYCQYCCAALSENAKFCTSCGSEQKNPAQTVATDTDQRLGGVLSKINDSPFARYLKNTNRWFSIFAVILAVVDIIVFFIYSKTSSEMENTQALFIGLGLGGIFLLIALFQIIGRGRSETWNGTVTDKKIENKSRRQNTSADDDYWVEFIEYIVFIKNNSGEKHQIKLRMFDHNIQLLQNRRQSTALQRSKHLWKI